MSRMAKGKDNVAPRINNRRAFHEYFIDSKLECGIALVGSEVKSLRAGKAHQPHLPAFPTAHRKGRPRIGVRAAYINRAQRARHLARKRAEANSDAQGPRRVADRR